MISAPRQCETDRRRTKASDQFTSTLVFGRNAQIPVIGRRSTERIEPIPSLPFEYWLGGGILWLAQHITSASTAFVLSRMMPGGCAMSETRKIAAILVSDVVGYSRLAGADEDDLARLSTLRSDLFDPRFGASWPHRQAHRRGASSNSAAWSTRFAARSRCSRHGRAQAGVGPESASSFASAFIRRRRRGERRRPDGRRRQHRRRLKAYASPARSVSLRTPIGKSNSGSISR